MRHRPKIAALMSLEAGTRLGPYEILAPIGAGGMGEVYRAKDTKLGRDVAIKVLPEDFARDPERLARFKREAQVLASLNHPNIAAIHGLEEEDSQPFLVLELVEGEDLAERLKRGPIPVDEVLEIAKQIAEALEEAHEKSIIHRDLKPANVKQTPEGVVKVLDFGLAKAFSREASQDFDVSNSPTRTRNETGAGVILGTAAYMSPEQAKGKPVDRRADIWSFGALVYEMLTGAKAFARNDVSETLAAILRDEPDWNRVPAPTPPKLRELLERCLRKNPRERQRDMGDARLELESDDDVPVVRESSRLTMALVQAFIVGAMIIFSLWIIDTPPPALLTKMVIPLPEGQRLVERRPPPIAVSPNGRTIVYAAESEGASNLYLRPLDSDEATVIRGTDDGHSPFFSPDGRWVGFYTDEALKKVAVEGGPPMTLAPAEPSTLGATWGRDGTIVYAPGAGAGATLMKISQAGGEPEPLTPGDQTAGNPGGPQILPDGDTVLFTETSTNLGDSWTASLASGEVSKPDAPAGAIAFTSTGHLLYWSAGSVAAVPFDARARATSGDGAVVLERVASNATSQFNANPYLAFSDNGTLAYISGETRTERLVLADRNGNVKRLTDDPIHAPRISPDARRIAYGGGENVVVYDIERETGTRFSISSQGLVAWKGDSRTIAFQDSGKLFEMPADGSAEPSVLFERGHPTTIESWSRDGRYLTLTEATPSTGLDIWILRLGGEPEPFLVTPADENAAIFSSNGRFVAYQSDESGQDEVYVRPFPGSEAQWKISTQGGTAPVWSHDGAELFYRKGKKLMAVSVATEDEFEVGTPELVLSGNYVVDTTGHPGYDVMPDGQSFVMVQQTRDAPLTEIHVVLNWFSELERLVPTK